MFGTKRRTYASKKSECGTIRHKDILNAVDTNTLFDALSSTNIKKYRKDNSYLYPNRLSTLSNARTKPTLGKIAAKKALQKKEESLKNDLFLNSSSDTSLHVKHNSNDLFDQLKNSVTNADEAFNNLLNGISIVRSDKVDPRINLSTDSSAYSPAKEDVPNDPSFQLCQPKQKKTYTKKKKKTKPVLHLTANGETSRSINDFDFVVEPCSGNSSPLVAPDIIIAGKDNIWNGNTSSFNQITSPTNYAKNRVFDVNESLEDSEINIDKLLKNTLPTSTPYGKTNLKLVHLQNGSIDIFISPRLEDKQDPSNIFNSFSDLHLKETESENSHTSSKYSNESSSAIENLDPKLLLVPVVVLEKLKQDSVRENDDFYSNISEISNDLNYTDCDSNSEAESFHGFPSESEDGKPEPLCLGLSPRKPPLLHSPDIFSCNSSDVSCEGKNNEINTYPILNQRIYEKLKEIKKYVDISDIKYAMSPRVHLIRDHFNSNVNKTDYCKANLSNRNSERLIEEYNKKVPIVVLKRLSHELKSQTSNDDIDKKSINQIEGNDGINKIPVVVLTDIMKTNIFDTNISNTNVRSHDEFYVYASPIRLNDSETILGDVRIEDTKIEFTPMEDEYPENLVEHFNESNTDMNAVRNSMDCNLTDSFNQSLFDNTCLFITKRNPSRYTNIKSKESNMGVNTDDTHLSKRDSMEHYPIESYNFTNNPMINTMKRDTIYRKTIAPRPSIILEPGKRWERSLNILRNLNRTNMSINDTNIDFNTTVVNNGAKKGRKFNQNVTHLLEMQNTDGGRQSFGDVTHHFQDVLSSSRRYSVMIVEEPSLEEDGFNRSQLSNSALYNSLYTDSCNETKVNLSRVSLPEDCSKRRSVVLKREGEDYFDHEHWSGLTAKDIVLRRCNQSEPLPFHVCYPPEKLAKCFKIGEGVYGEVFLFKNEEDPANPIVMKVIPIEGELIVNGDRQKTFGEIISEIVIAMELSDLRNNKENFTSAFNKVNRVRCVQGRYPDSLVDLWELYDEQKGSENDNPSVFDETQLYIVLECANGGQDLEAFRFKDAEQSYYLFLQVAFALAVAEETYQFEHRDLHWGNILISKTEQQSLRYSLRGEEFRIPCDGVQCSIIDYTLSRITLPSSTHLTANHIIYNDLSKDPDLFNADGDYQFDIYRLMKEKNGDSWQHFEPFSNILWLHYTLDKMITALRYERTTTETHQLFISKLSVLKDTILQYDSSVDFVSSTQCYSLLNDV